MKWKTSASIEHKLQPGLRFCHVMDAQSRNLGRGRVKGRRAFQEGRLVSDDDAGLFCLVGEGLKKQLLSGIGQGTESISSSDTWQTQKRFSNSICLIQNLIVYVSADQVRNLQRWT
jgi:hypothetical protein